MKPKARQMHKYKDCSHVHVSLCTVITHNTVQNSSDNLNLQTITIAQMMSTGGERAKRREIKNKWCRKGRRKGKKCDSSTEANVCTTYPCVRMITGAVMSPCNA